MVMKQLGEMVDLEGLSREKGEYITPFNSYHEYESLIDQNEFDEMIERDEIKKHYDLHGLDKSEPFLFIDSSGSDGGQVFVGEDRLDDLLHYMKSEPQTYKKFTKHVSMMDYYLSEIEDKLDNNGVDYELDSTRFGSDLYIDDELVGKGIVTIDSEDLCLYIGDYDATETGYVQLEKQESLDSLLEAIDRDLIKSVKFKNKDLGMEM